MQGHTYRAKPSRALAIGMAVLMAAFLLVGIGATPAVGSSPVKPVPLSSLTINGYPITITIEDSAQLDITYRGEDQHQFFGGDAEGVYLWADSAGTMKVFGPEWVQSGNGANPYEFVSNTASGIGTSANPYVVTTVLDVPGTPLRLIQRVSYMNGAEFVGINWEMQQISGSAPVQVKLFHAAEFTTAGNPGAYGYRDAATGSVGDFIIATGGNFYQEFVPNAESPADAYQESFSHEVWDAIGTDSALGPGLSNTINAAALHDSGVALQWNLTVPTTGTVSVGDTILFSKHPELCGQFSDVPIDAYYYEYVRYLTCNGIVSGYSDTTFRPSNTATRAQLAKMIVLARGWDIDTSGGPHFADVPDTNPFDSYVETAYHRGVISGYSDGTFRPGGNVTRGQTTKMIVTAMGWDIDTSGGAHFVDVPPSNPFYIYVETAFHHNIISGYADETFRWGNDITRGQMSKVLYLSIMTAR